VDLLIGLVLGVIASLGAWWIIWRGLRPKLLVSSKISKVADESEDGRFIYRVKIAAGKGPLARAVSEMVGQAYIWIPGLVSDRPKLNVRFDLALQPPEGIQYLPKRYNRILRFALEEGRLVADRRDILARFPKITSLEELFDISGGYPIRLVLSFSDAYTGSRRTQLYEYRPEDIVRGSFGISGKSVVDVIPSTESVEEPTDP
jgi:hypothetical protein